MICFATMLGARMGRWLGPRGCLNCDLRGFVGMGCDLLCNDVGREDGAMVGTRGLSEL